MKKNQTREKMTSFLRISWILQQIQENQYPNTSRIADKFEVSHKTAQRTLDFIRDQMRLPIEYSAKKRGWYCKEPLHLMSWIQITEGELLVLLLAEKLTQNYQGTILGEIIEKAFTKVIQAMPETISIDTKTLMSSCSFEAPVTSIFNSETFLSLLQTIREKKRIEIVYYTASRGKKSHRKVDPIHLRHYLGECYLIAFDHFRKTVRDFHVGRILELKVTSESFEISPEFDLEQYLNSGFFMTRGNTPTDLEIIFDEYQARWIRGHSPLHPTETREELPEGRLKVCMKVGALEGVKRYVMQHGAHIEVVRPEELRQMIREDIQKMQKIYED